MSATSNQHLADAAEYLRRAIDEADPVLPARQALTSMIKALAPGSLLDFDKAMEVSRLLFAVAPCVAEAVRGRLAAEHVYVGFGCAAAAMGCMTIPRRYSLIAYVALLEAELKAVSLRNKITSDGELDLALMLARSTPNSSSFAPEAPTVH